MDNTCTNYTIHFNDCIYIKYNQITGLNTEWDFFGLTLNVEYFGILYPLSFAILFTNYYIKEFVNGK
jgi:hypothetical protein